MTRLACLVALACLLAGCGSDGGGASERSDLIGIVSEDVFAGDAAYREANLDKQADAGVGLIRQTFDRAQIETAPGEYDFSRYDAWLEALAQERMRVLPILFEAGGDPPDDFAAFGQFAAAVVDRYGPKGTFWREHGDLPEFPIRAWQVWNEPNLPQYWGGDPDAAEYVELLNTASRAIRHVDPDAEVVSAGVPNSKHGVPLIRYLDDMLGAGAARYFDTLAIHPYATDVEGVWSAVTTARRALRRDGSRAPIWVTEIGWATSGPQSPFTVGAQGQAVRLTQLFDEFPAQRERLGIRGLVYYNWKDSPRYAGGSDFWGLYSGLLTIDGAEKPGFAAFDRGVQSLPAD